MSDIEQHIIENISTFANLNHNQKQRYTCVYPERIVDMLDYLINITKD